MCEQRGPFFSTVSCQGSAGGLRVCVQTGPCMHAGHEEGECKASGRSLSGGIKALLQW